MRATLVCHLKTNLANIYNAVTAAGRHVCNTRKRSAAVLQSHNSSGGAVLPGGGTDITVRLIAPKMSEMWGQQVVVENGAEPVCNTPDEFAMIIRNDLVKWAKVIRDAGITVE